MSKSNAKSLGSLRQKHRKYIKDFEEDVKKFTENPDAADDEDEKEMSKVLLIYYVSSFDSPKNVIFSKPCFPSKQKDFSFNITFRRNFHALCGRHVIIRKAICYVSN